MDILDYLRTLNRKLEENGGSIPKDAAVDAVGGEQILGRLVAEEYISISPYIHENVRVTEKGKAAL